MTIAVCVLSVLVVYLAWNQRRLRKAIGQQQNGLGNLSQSLIELFFDQNSPINQMNHRSLSMDRDLMRAMRVERRITDEQVRIVAQSARLLAMLENLSVSEAAAHNGMRARCAAQDLLIDRNGLTDSATKNLHVYRAINMVLERAQEQIEEEARQQTVVRELIIDAQRQIDRFERQSKTSENLIKAKSTLASAATMLANHDYASAKVAADTAYWLAIACSPN